MTSAPMRDPLADHLITPQNAALVLIDYQPSQLAGVRSMARDLLLKNAVSTVRTVKALGFRSCIRRSMSPPAAESRPVPELAGLLADDKPLDRTTVNSWEVIEFIDAIHATSRRKLIFCALWTEVCMAFTALDALREGFEVYPRAHGLPRKRRASNTAEFSSRELLRASITTLGAWPWAARNWFLMVASVAPGRMLLNSVTRPSTRASGCR